MDAAHHTLGDLFAQLGLAGDAASVERFIAAHRPLGTDVALAAAPFWNAAQAGFLHEQLLQDADWAELIDQLDLALRAG